MEHTRRGSLGILLLTVVGLLLPTAASANGAMSLALATFGWGMWLPYVVVTVAFEAVMLSRWLRVPMRRALKTSLGANFLTAIIGGFFSGILAYIFYDSFGSRLNPNPFFQNLLLFTLFGVGSACVEAILWDRVVEKSLPAETSTNRPKARPRSVLAWVLLVHLLGVPVGLGVLLIPARPYPGLEGRVGGERRRLDYAVQKALQGYIMRNHRVPSVQTYEELLELLKPDLDRYAHDPDLWAAAYIPHYARFDTGERRREPLEWNRSIAGRKLSEDSEEILWLTRRTYYGYYQGLIVNGDYVDRTRDPKQLGYTNVATTGR
jgi:hypothetical protein